MNQEICRIARFPRTRILSLRLSEREREAITAAYAVSRENTLSDFLRRVLMEGISAPAAVPAERGAPIVAIR